MMMMSVATCTLSAEHTAVCAVFYFYPSPADSQWTQYVTSKTETETENRFWPYPKPKNRFYRTIPVLETLVSGLRWPVSATQSCFIFVFASFYFVFLHF